MKKSLTILSFLYVCLISYSQTRNDFDNRAKNGNLSYKDCVILLESGDVESALPSLNKLLSEYENSFSIDVVDEYLNLVFHIYDYYNSIGKVTITHKLLWNANRLIRSIGYTENTSTLRELYIKMGNVESVLKSHIDALSYYMLVQQMCNVVNDKSEKYILLLCNISIEYLNINDPLMSKIYIDEAKELYEQRYGDLIDNKVIEDDLHVFILVAYGNLCYYVNNLDEAYRTYKLIIDIHEDYSIDESLLAIVYNNISQILLYQDRFEESLAILSQITSRNSEINYMVSQNLSWTHLLLNNNNEATHFLKAFNSAAKQNVVSVFSIFSEMDRERYWNQYAMTMMTINNLVAFKTQNPDAIIEAYNNSLFCKTLLHGTSQIIKKYIHNSSDKKLINDYNELVELRDSLSYISAKTIVDKEEIADKLARKEEELLSSIEGIDDLIVGNSGRWSDVVNMLNEDEAAIDFCFIITMDSIANAKDYYGAFILRKDSKAPQMILLSEIGDVDEIIDSAVKDDFNINDFYISDRSNDFYKITWDKIEPFLEGCLTVYYSTTGQLANINIDLIRDTAGIPLNEKYKLVRVSSTNNIMTVKDSFQKSLKGAVLYGDINYDENLSDMLRESEVYSVLHNSQAINGLSLRSISNRGSWGKLYSTKDEIISIENVLKNNNITVRLITGNSANEESLKSHSGNSPDIIHFATHGFYISSAYEASINSFFSRITPYSEKERYMQWSGVLLAGANNAWNGRFSLENVEDGILTADEISRLDLSKTKLVILSACETAKGHIDPVDGVYGLQQAFKKAGVGTIVMSLWKVPDEATSLLMEHFYKSLMEGIEKHDALNAAMKQVRQKYNDPYYWAGFIMLD